MDASSCVILCHPSSFEQLRDNDAVFQAASEAGKQLGWSRKMVI